jgi:hypothetical protein
VTLAVKSDKRYMRSSAIADKGRFESLRAHPATHGSSTSTAFNFLGRPRSNLYFYSSNVSNELKMLNKEQSESSRQEQFAWKWINNWWERR